MAAITVMPQFTTGLPPVQQPVDAISPLAEAFQPVVASPLSMALQSQPVGQAAPSSVTGSTGSIQTPQAVNDMTPSYNIPQATVPPTVIAGSYPTQTPFQYRQGQQSYTLSPCELGLCGPTGQIGVANQMPVYMTDGGRSVFTSNSPGGVSLLGQMMLSQQFQPGALGAFLGGQDQAQLSGQRNTDQYAALYQQFLQQTGDPEAASALADAQVLGQDPAFAGAWSNYLAPTNADQLTRARNRAAGAALATGDASVAGRPYVEGTYQPGFAITGTGEIPGTISTAFGGQSTGTRGVDSMGAAFGLPATVNSQGATGILQSLQSQRNATQQLQQAQQQQAAAAFRQQLNAIQAENAAVRAQAQLLRAQNSQQRGTAAGTPTAPVSVGGINFVP